MGQLALALAFIGSMVVLGKVQARRNAGPLDLTNGAGAATVAGSDTAPSTAPTAQQALGAFQVLALNGKREPVAVKGEPGIIMVSSVSCGWCKRALADLGRMAEGRPLPRLTLLTLEGAAEGSPMLAKERITGARLVGPAGSNDQVLMTFRYPGTPTFVAVDRNGRVVATMPGYPIPEVMKSWYAVMVGDAETPL